MVNSSLSLSLPPEPAFIDGRCPLPEKRVATEGDEVSFNCTVRGNIRPTLEWMFGNETIVEGGQFDFVLLDMSLGVRMEDLVISDVSPENSGVYTCIATNIFGMGSYSYSLEVLGQY